MEVLHMIGGMPRSGSTLLCNVLAQNPRIQSTCTSGCMDVMFGVRNQWDNLIEHKAAPPEDSTKKRVLAAVLNSYHADKPEPIVLDKCRGWLNLIETAEYALERKIKIIVPVRDLRDILASFEKLWQTHRGRGPVLGEQDNYAQFQSLEGRLQYWMRQDQVVGLAFTRVLDALHRGFRDRLHFVDYDQLTQQPAETLNAIYEFLGEQPFAHNFDHIEQVTVEDDGVHGVPGLHTIQPALKASTPQYPKVLGTIAERYAPVARFWENK